MSKRKAYKKKSELRVTLVCRVDPETMRLIRHASKRLSGRGRALDALVIQAKDMDGGLHPGARLFTDYKP